MEDLIEIARLIASVGLKKPDHYFAGNDNTMLIAFFDGLVKGTITDDESAAQLLYKSTSTDHRYRTLKSRFREKIFEASLFINFSPPDFSELRQKMYECNRELNAMKQCIENGAQAAGATLARRLLVKARKYHLTIIELECLYAILNHVVYCVGSELEFHQTSVELRHVQQKLNTETEAEIIFGAVSVKYSLIVSDHPENAPFIEESIAKLELLIQQFDTFKIRYNYYLLRSWYGQVVRNFPKRIAACDEAIEYFRNNPSIAGNLVAIFTSEKADCYFHLRDYEQFLKLAKECDSLLDKNTSNWLIIKCFEIQTLLSINESVRALEVFTGVRKLLKRSSGGIAKITERWLILEGYVLFFLHTQSPATEPTISQNPPLEKYLRTLVSSELSSSSTDKVGANVGMMILHVLLLIALRSNPTDIAEKVVALDRYRRRYLDQQSNLRTETFVTMLRHLSFDNFNMQITGKKTKDLYLKLVPATPTTIDSTEDYELIPFDIIWKRLMDFYGVEN